MEKITCIMKFSHVKHVKKVCSRFNMKQENIESIFLASHFKLSKENLPKT